MNAVSDPPFHPLADVLPLIEGPEFDRLVADIAEHGLKDKITLYDGMILDGRNRYRACRVAGVTPDYIEFDDKDPAAFVLTKNLVRRHLGPSERAMVAARMANLKWGQRADRVEGSIDLSTAAKLVSVSEPSVKRARVVLEHGTPELVQAVDHGRIAVHEAYRKIKQARAREAYEERAEKGGTCADLSDLARAGKKFAVIYADPPWEFKVYSGKGKQRSAERHNDTQSLDDIKALPVGDLAADDCALFLWSVWPEHPGALEVIKAWGFEFKTDGFVWVKTTEKAEVVKLDGEGLHWGMGYWTRANTEPCLLATRGNPQRLAQDVHQIILAPVGRHSEKPEEARRRIERLLAGPYLELFARRSVDGWTTWGNEVPSDEGPPHSWKNPGDEQRFERYLALSGKCALGRAQFESPRYAAVAVANQESKPEEEYIDDPRERLKLVRNYIAAEEAQKAEDAMNAAPALEAAERKEPAPFKLDDACDGELA
jgi:N6-adenosine-specific RNA methylase IME4/ParB-like chromosome segregation protein Spo0J